MELCWASTCDSICEFLHLFFLLLSFYHCSFHCLFEDNVIILLTAWKQSTSTLPFCYIWLFLKQYVHVISKILSTKDTMLMEMATFTCYRHWRQVNMYQNGERGNKSHGGCFWFCSVQYISNIPYAFNQSGR